MPGPDLPVNLDTAYADTDPENAGVKDHQQHHDALHGLANQFDVDATPSDGDAWLWDSGTGLYVPTPAVQGAQGDEGPQGDPGADGQDGASAYELAVLEGFAGSLTDWLESLGAFPGESPFRFFQEGEIGLADSDDFFVFPFDADIEGLYLTAITPASVTPVVVDYLKTEPSDTEESLWADPDDRPELLADEQYSGVFTPDTELVPAGTMMKVSVVEAGEASEGGSFTVRSVSDDSVSSGSTTLSSWAIPLPSSFAEGDRLCHIFVTGAQTVTDLPDDWVDMVTGSTTPTPVQDTASSLHVYCIVKDALDPLDESLAQVITLSGGAVVNGRTLAFRSPEAIGSTVDDVDSDFEDTATASVTAPALTTSFVSEIGLWVAAARFTNGDGATITVDGDLTELHNLVTTRTGTNTNIALAIATLDLPTATTYDTYVFATSPNTRWVVRDFALVGGEAVEETPGSDLFGLGDMEEAHHMMAEKPVVSTSIKIGASVPRPHSPKAGRPDMIPVGFFHRGGPPSSSSTDAAWAGITIPKRWVQGRTADIRWADMQPDNQGQTFDPSNPISDAISSTTESELQLKLRFMYGSDAPGWAKSIGGAPVNLVETQGAGTPFTIGRVWLQPYVAAGADFIEQFASVYNTLAFPVTQLLAVSCSITMTKYAEPFVRQSLGNETNTLVQANKAAMLAAGWTLNQDVLAQTAMMEAHRPVDMLVSLACNPYQKVNDGSDVQITRSLMQYFRGTLAQWGCLGNNSDRVAPGWPNAKYAAMYNELIAQGPPSYIQTAAPARVGNLYETCVKAVAYGATYIELPGTTEQYTDTDTPQGMSPDQFDEILDGLIANAANIGYDFELPADPPPPAGPQVTNFTPSTATVGSTVTILGTGLLGATSVTFNGVAASYTVINSTTITAVVPAGATTGPINVTTPTGSDASNTNFVVDAGLPLINSFTPTTGQVGASVTIQGDNFTGATVVRFNTTLASFTVVDDNTILATVPVGATTGRITVITGVGTVQSATNFTVSVPPPAAPVVTSFAPLSGSAATGGGDGIPLGGPYNVGILTFTVNVPAVGNRTCTARYPSVAGGTNAAPAAGVFPLVMVGHGSALDGASAATTHNFLAQDGYIVVGPSFGNIVGNITEGAVVTSAVIDYLDALTSGQSGGLLAGKVDVDRIGYAGTSMGGMIGYRLMHPTGGDPRILAFFLRAANATGSPGGDFDTGPALLHCHGTSDGTVSNASGHSAYDRAQEPKGFIDLAGAGHDLNVSGTYFQNGARGLFKRYVADLAGGPAQIELGVSQTPTATYTNDGIAEATQAGGTSVVITGTGFTGATAVRFNGVSASYVVNSGTQITATVPTGASTGPITVTTANGTGQSSTNFIITGAAPPTITSFTPTSGVVGTSVAIVGTAFTGVSAVRFNGVNAAYVVNSQTSITATVPAGASTGVIQVVATAGTATSGASFTVPAPTITSFTPTSGGGSTTVTITGTGFLGSTAVTFNGVAAASFTVVSATRVDAVVPGTATTGPIRVIGPAGTALSAASFTVTGASVWRNPGGVWSIRQTTSSAMGSAETTGANNSLNKAGVVGYGRRFGANLVLPATQGGNVNLSTLQVGLDKAKSMGKLFKPRVMLGQYLPSWATGPTFTDQYGTGPIGFTNTGGAVAQLEEAIQQLAEAFAAFAVANPEVMMIDCAWPSLDYSELNYSPGVQNAYGRSEPTNRASSIAAHQRIMKIWYDAITPAKVPVGFGLSGRGPITNHAIQLTAYAHTLAGNDSPAIILQANGWGYVSGVYGEWGGGLESALDAALFSDIHVAHAVQDIHPANGGPRSEANWDQMFNGAQNSPVRAKYAEIYSDQFGLTYNTNQAAYDRMLSRIASFAAGPF